MSISVRESIVVGGEMLTIADAATKYKMATADEIVARIENGWTGVRAALTPADDALSKIDNEYFGLLMTMDVFGADPKKINSLDSVHAYLHDLPESIGMVRISPPIVFHYSDPDPTRSGISGTVFLSTSSASYHAFPNKDNYFSLDIFSCKSFSPYLVLEQTKAVLGGDRFEIQTLFRGKGFKN